MKKVKFVQREITIFDDFLKIHVYLWNSKNAMYQYFDAIPEAKRKHDYLGRCLVDYDYLWEKGCYGELHFVISEIGSGYVAHEIQHLMNYIREKHFCDSVELDEEDDETLAKVCERITTEFWKIYYEHVLPKKALSDFEKRLLLALEVASSQNATMNLPTPSNNMGKAWSTMSPFQEKINELLKEGKSYDKS